MKEKWKDIQGFEGHYQISNLGRVKSIKFGRELIMSQHLNKSGYKMVLLKKPKFQKNCTIHRLIANAFLKNKFNLPQINHKDGNKLNNNLNNLEWISHKDNAEHAKKNNLLKPKKGIDHYRSKKVICVELNKVFLTVNDAAKFINRDKSAITHNCKGRTKKCGGYTWKYLDE